MSPAVVIAALLAGCVQEAQLLLPPDQVARTAPTIREACAMTAQKCSRCHDLDRIRLAHHALVDWDAYVDKMRRQPGSGITTDDAGVILRCLDHMKQLQREQDW
jgi:hypothetical protein